MVFQLGIVIVIPIILGIVTVLPFNESKVVEETEEINDTSKFGMLYFFLMLIWFFS